MRCGKKTEFFGKERVGKIKFDLLFIIGKI